MWPLWKQCVMAPAVLRVPLRIAFTLSGWNSGHSLLRYTNWSSDNLICAMYSHWFLHVIIECWLEVRYILILFGHARKHLSDFMAPRHCANCKRLAWLGCVIPCYASTLSACSKSDCANTWSENARYMLWKINENVTFNHLIRENNTESKKVLVHN